MICRRAVELVTQSLDEPLPPAARLGLGVHALFCSPCRRFRRQMRRLHGLLGQTPDGASDSSRAGGLSEAARARIAAALNREAEPR